MFIDEDGLSCTRPPRGALPVRQPAILYVESNGLLAQLASDLLDMSSWHIRRAENGTSARIFLNSEQHYALLLVDNELRDTTGLELVRYARSLRHRKSLPIMLFSIEDCEREAKEAGANEFLRKPHDLFRLLELARKLVAASGKKRYK